MSNKTYLILMISLFAGTLGSIIGSELQNARWRHEIIQRGYGLYCPVEGNFAFTGECK